jgi:hypothetical protein
MGMEAVCIDNRAHTLNAIGQQYEEAHLVEMGEAESDGDYQPVMVSCPSRVRKAIVRNLRAAAHSRSDPDRAKIALRILWAVDNGGPEVGSMPKGIPTARAEHIGATAKSIPASAWARVGGVVAGTFRKVRATVREHIAKHLFSMRQATR